MSSKRLTEEMVIARTKISDLTKIKRLNCWGSEIGDIALLRRMPNVEVLSLSVNRISTLEDIEFCKRLEELYIRQNEIKDLNQVVFLQSLMNLKNLWLGENPCASEDGYRLAVIRTLPQLQKLDNVMIGPEETRDAQKRGRILQHPADAANVDEDCGYGSEQRSSQKTAQQQQQQQQIVPEQRRYVEYVDQDYDDLPGYCSPVETRRQTHDTDNEVSEEYYGKDEISEENSKDYSPPAQQSPTRRASTTRRPYSPDKVAYTNDRFQSYERESPPNRTASNRYYGEDHPAMNDLSIEDDVMSTTNSNNYDNNTCRDTKLSNSQSVNCLKEYTNGDRLGFTHSANPLQTSLQQQQQQQQQQQPPHNVQSYRTAEDVSSVHSHERREPRFSAANSAPPSAPKPPFTRRPVTRNSNILSAVLCLVKELDYPSLEVVDMAVRCRMDELDD